MPTNPRTKKDYALELIRELIVAGELLPGERLQQGELAARLNISLTPLREALRQLEAEGLVAASAHRGVRVAEADPNHLREVHIVRRLLEPDAARRAVDNLSQAQLRKAGQLLHELDGAHDRNDALAVRRTNYDFHFLIYEASQVPLLEQLIENLWIRFPWDVLTVVPGRMIQSRAEHHRILEALIAHDRDEVEAAIADHLVASYLSIKGHLDGAADRAETVRGGAD